MAKNGPQQMSWPVFATHYAGLPVPEPSLPCLQRPGTHRIHLPPQFLRRARMNPPTSLWKGKSRGGVVALAGAPLVGPTSLNRGEGLLAGLTREVGAGEDEGGGGGERR